MSIATRHRSPIYTYFFSYPRLPLSTLLATLQIGLAMLLATAALVCVLHCHLVRLTAPPTASIAGVTLAICHGGAPAEGVPAVNTLLLFSIRDAPAEQMLVPLLLPHPRATPAMSPLPAAPQFRAAPPVPPPR